MRRVDWSDVPIPLLGRDDIGPGRLGLAEQNNGRVVFEDFLAGSPEKSLLKNSDSPALLGTAKLNGLDPAKWLKDTLEKLPTWPNRRIDELLPFSAEQLAAIQLQNSDVIG